METKELINQLGYSIMWSDTGSIEDRKDKVYLENNIFDIEEIGELLPYSALRVGKKLSTLRRRCPFKASLLHDVDLLSPELSSHILRIWKDRYTDDVFMVEDASHNIYLHVRPEGYVHSWLVWFIWELKRAKAIPLLTSIITDPSETTYPAVAKILSAYLSAGWEVRTRTVDDEEITLLVYPKRIQSTQAIFKGRIYPLQVGVDLYINRLTIPLTHRIFNVFAQEAHHPNVRFGMEDLGYGICVGEFYGKPIIEGIRLPEILKTANFDSCFSPDYWIEDEKFAEYIDLEEECDSEVQYV